MIIKNQFKCRKVSKDNCGKDMSMSGEKRMFCANCGSEILVNAKFCINCGTKVENPVLEEVEAEASNEPVPEAADPVTDDEIEIHYEEESADFSPYPGSQYYEAETVTQEETGGKIGFSIASMVCGILSLLCCCLNEFCLILAIVAVVLGVIAIREDYDGRGMATAGIITGALGIVISVSLIIIGGFTLFNMKNILE